MTAEEVFMRDRRRLARTTKASFVVAYVLGGVGAIALTGSDAGAAAGATTAATAGQTAPAMPGASPAGPLAFSCGVPATPAPETGGGRAQLPIIPAGHFR